MSSLLSPAATPLDLNNLLAEILLRLPPEPSSLPRASAVCKRWRLLVSDRRFLRRFRIHHTRNPPLLGFFIVNSSSLFFVPTMEAPNRIPPERLSLQIDHGHGFQPLGCRHGLALISDLPRQKLLVWEPFTRDQHHIAFPPGFDPATTTGIKGAVLRAAGEVHFQVIFMATAKTQTGIRALAYVYSSETGLWGEPISIAIPLEPDSVSVAELYGILYHTGLSSTPSVLVGDSLYWQLTICSSRILEFDFEKQSLAVIQVPVDLSGGNLLTVIRADSGGLGFLFVSNFTAQLWERNTDCGGVASWVLGRTIELDKLLSLDTEVQGNIMMLWFAEENNMVFLGTLNGLFAVQLQSLQFKKLCEFNITADFYPFESIYTPDIGGEHDGAELPHNA